MAREITATDVPYSDRGKLADLVAHQAEGVIHHQNSQVMDIYYDFWELQSENKDTPIWIMPEHQQCLRVPMEPGGKTVRGISQLCRADEKQVMEAVESGKCGPAEWLEMHRLIKVSHGKHALEMFMTEMQVSSAAQLA